MDGIIQRSGSRRHLIAVIDGPNMSFLGRRHEKTYGSLTSLQALQDWVRDFGDKVGVQIESFASNFEGAILEYIHESSERVDAYLINPAGLTVGNQAVHHILVEIGLPVGEVHFANIHAHSTDRRPIIGPAESSFTPSMSGLCMGYRHYSYAAAIVAMTMSLDDPDFLGKHLIGRD